VIKIQLLTSQVVDVYYPSSVDHKDKTAPPSPTSIPLSAKLVDVSLKAAHEASPTPVPPASRLNQAVESYLATGQLFRRLAMLSYRSRRRSGALPPYAGFRIFNGLYSK